MNQQVYDQLVTSWNVVRPKLRIMQEQYEKLSLGPIQQIVFDYLISTGISAIEVVAKSTTIQLFNSLMMKPQPELAYTFENPPQPSVTSFTKAEMIQKQSDNLSKLEACINLLKQTFTEQATINPLMNWNQVHEVNGDMVANQTTLTAAAA